MKLYEKFMQFRNKYVYKIVTRMSSFLYYKLV
jgi:hypothetical protein